MTLTAKTEHITPRVEFWNALSSFARIQHVGIEFGYRRGVWAYVPLAFWRGALIETQSA